MKDVARRVFETEIESLNYAAGLIDDSFDAAVQTILNSNGKTIVTGIGKSGLIGTKIAATLASTGTPSFYMHPTDAFHGDLGMIGPDDIVILISYSGESDEVLKLIPFLKWHQNKIVSITGYPGSTIAKNSDVHLCVTITREACPLELAPTSSSTATLVMGDALAIALMEARDFKHEDFARFHPGGSLGRKLLVKVKDLMRTDNLPFIDENASFTDVLMRMSEGRLGMVMVGSKEHIKGIITDGDLRRALVKNSNISALSPAEMMTTSPIIVNEDELISPAEHLMIQKKITTLLVGNSATRSIAGVYQIYSQ